MTNPTYTDSVCLITLTAAGLSLIASPAIAQNAGNDAVRAYYYRAPWGSGGYRPENLRLEGITHLYHFTAGLNLTSGEISRPDTANLALTRTHCRKHGVKIIGVVAKFNRDQFMGVLNDAGKRAACVASIDRWVREERLDGIDIDFEHPASQTDANTVGTFMTELRSALGPRAFISYAMAQWYSFTSVPTGVINDSMDVVNIMSYDHGGEHASWTYAQSDMQFYHDRGVLPSRLVLGVPFYGVHTTDRNANPPKSYSWLLNDMSYTPGEFQNTHNGYFFNSRGLIYNKAYLGAQQGNGIFAWTIDHDVTGSLSLRDSMVRGGENSQVMLEGFEYPLFSKCGAGLNKSSTIKFESTERRRTSGIYGGRAIYSFNGVPWCNATFGSPELPAFSVPSGAVVRLDAYVESKAGSMVFFFYDNQGQRVRASDYVSFKSTGWKSIRFKRGNFSMLDDSFDWDNVVKWSVYLEGGNGSTAVSPFMSKVVFDHIAIVNPASKRPLRMDSDADGDSLPEVCAATTRWIDRFTHPKPTKPEMIYQITAMDGAEWSWKESFYYPGQHGLRARLPYDGSAYQQVKVKTPVQPAYAVNADSVLHFELDVLSAMADGTLRVDLIDADGNSSLVSNYLALDSVGLKNFDLKASTFEGDADLSRLTQVQLLFQGTHVEVAPFVSELEVRNLVWGNLPLGSAVKSLEGDADGDGLSDAAEDRNLNGQQDAGETATDLADSDGDGCPDGVEMTTGTDPLDPARFFRVMPEMQAEGMILKWPSAPGATYRIEVSSSLQAADWHVLVSGLPAVQGAETSYDLGQSGEESKRFYRVVLE